MNVNAANIDICSGKSNFVIVSQSSDEARTFTQAMDGSRNLCKLFSFDREMRKTIKIVMQYYVPMLNRFISFRIDSD